MTSPPHAVELSGLLERLAPLTLAIHVRTPGLASHGHASPLPGFELGFEQAGARFIIGEVARQGRVSSGIGTGRLRLETFGFGFGFRHVGKAGAVVVLLVTLVSACTST